MYIYSFFKHIYTSLMSNKIDRHKFIRQIIASGRIANQNELRDVLESQGFATTQATLSRDLMALRIIKVPDAEKGHIYALSENYKNTPPQIEGNSPLQTCRSLDFSGNLAVLKCLPSFAPAVALVLDAFGMEEIVGTVAGDDTVLIILKEGLSHERFRTALVERLPELTERI
jgi:transcriptional regulator of arginine metabolism